MKRLLLRFFPVLLLVAATPFWKELATLSSATYQSGTRWMSSLFGVSLVGESGLVTGTNGRKYVQKDGNNQAFEYGINSLIAGEENFFWQLLFSESYTPGVTIPFRRPSEYSLGNRKQMGIDWSERLLQIPVIVREVTDPQLLALEYAHYEQVITVVQNKRLLIPFRDLDTLTFASLTIGATPSNYFQKYLDKYAPFRHFAVANTDQAARSYDALVKRLEDYKVVVVSLHNLNTSPLQAYGIPQSARTFIERLRTKTNVALVIFGTPYSLKYFDRLDYLVCAYDDNSVTQKLVPQILFGAVPATGKLPFTVTASLPAGTGYSTPSLKRLGYTVPERVGLQSTTLQRIDQLVEGYIQDSVMPGAQVLVAKNGKVVFEKAYGYLTYDKQTPVTTQTLYDLASVTKVAATLQAVMALQSKGVLDISRKASDYLPELKRTNKENMLVKDMLLHQAGLLAFQDHWTRTKTPAGLDSAFYSPALDELHPLVVAPGIYGIASLKDSLWQWTIQSRLLKKPHAQKKYHYKYSDLGFGILQQIVERLTGQPLDVHVNQTFYQPLGLDELTFNPLRKFGENRIAPTEQDKRFRGILLRGTVHDQEAALMGGVAGHAGLFGTANDLAALMQMNLQKGYYGGKQYFGENTLATFTKTYGADNPRGLGWDRPLPGGGGGVSDLASRNSFGHTGFTGTCVWVDPDEEIVYVFLSNRVYPDVDNTKLARYKVRQQIQHVIYEARSTPAALMAASKP